MLSVLNMTDPRYAETVFLSLSTARTDISIASPARPVVGVVISSCTTLDVVAAESHAGMRSDHAKMLTKMETRSFFINGDDG